MPALVILSSGTCGEMPYTFIYTRHHAGIGPLLLLDVLVFANTVRRVPC